MPSGRIVPRNPVRVGEYFVNMALNPATVNPPHPTRPEDWPDFLRNVLDCIVPLNFQRIHFHTSTMTELHFMVPPRELVQASLDDIRNDPNRRYPLNSEYQRIIGESTTLTTEQIFHFRVGEYTLSLCR